MNVFYPLIRFISAGNHRANMAVESCRPPDFSFNVNSPTDILPPRLASASPNRLPSARADASIAYAVTTTNNGRALSSALHASSNGGNDSENFQTSPFGPRPNDGGSI